MINDSTDAHLGLLAEHIRRALIRDLGATRIDVWLGKDGLRQHDVEELAAIVVGALQAVLTTPEVRDLTTRLHHEGMIAPPLSLDRDEW